MSSLKRKNFKLATAVAAASALVLAGCGGGDGDGGDAGGGDGGDAASLRMLTYDDETGASLLREQFATFTEETGIEVEL